MVPVDSDDLWYAYNLIAPGDTVLAVTVRYVLCNLCSQIFLIDLFVVNCRFMRIEFCGKLKLNFDKFVLE